jgi:hypothetical protein
MSDIPAVDYEVRPVEGTGETAGGTPRFAIHLRQGEVVGHVIAWTATEVEARYIVSALRREDRRLRSLGPEVGRLVEAERAAGGPQRASPNATGCGWWRAPSASSWPGAGGGWPPPAGEAPGADHQRRRSTSSLGRDAS